jgi:hypothetical protein
MGFKQRRPRVPNEERRTVVVTFNLPRWQYTQILHKADKTKLPIGRLIGWAVDNELEKGKEAFLDLWGWPETEYIEGAYVEEARKILNYLNKFGSQSIDQLVLQRRDIGIANKDSTLLGIRELLERKVLVELVDVKRKFGEADYKVIRVKETLDEKKRKEIKNLREKLAKLEGTDAEEES